ncbi:lytic murein transglycosylase B [Pusillimonas noertemannii]|uniref:Membrane-bound lytic murein transglycosylase B n=1 Tax=Pusillimonas noertemannii TaxID=305977 RepID=A0A2U1CT01_9BURK|nr:lytic murein transglycosylase B [Pusillimonas noertemannii]NYT70535.1 lytic murein transglycosylase B [Pusillimonas noertemannii]PVY68954.1 membrane-bound lytic murein transglycosylase B [Pusillimonas noertemannii]TFL11604.1 lytic murein transglycosylase B [Pusillimonas noertemannii]
MFKPVRILQVAAAVLLGGCASSHTAPPSAQNSPAAQAAPAASASSHARRPPAASVDANGFVDAQGRLKPEVQSYARQVAAKHKLPLSHVEALLEDARYNAKAAELMSPSKTRVRRSWVTYRKRFVEPVRIRAGVEFWNENRAMLDRAAAQYGVPPSIIVAIIGVETVYGRYTGSFSVLDAIATLAFRYPDPQRPERSQLFQDQLADLILLDYQGVLDARQATGSFAGAMGLPQFMPGSLMRYAADGNGDRHIDLAASPEDAIASVANFLVQHGWQPGLPVFAPVALPADAKSLVHGGLEPVYDWEQLKTRGASKARAPADSSFDSDWTQHKLGIVDLVDEPRKTAEYRCGTPNFFAITHYNRSYFYATSVADLAQELASRMGYGAPN